MGEFIKIPWRYQKKYLTLPQKENKAMENQWFENLPPSCPPSDASECEGTYYRVTWLRSKSFDVKTAKIIEL